MKYLLLITILFITSCSNKKVIVNHGLHQIPMQFCINALIKKQFENFHNSAFLGSSSSLNGLSQDKIFEVVKQHVVEYVKDTTCYKEDNGVYNPDNFPIIRINNQFILKVNKTMEEIENESH